MKATTMLDTIESLLGTPACAIPLSCCKPAKGYLLDKAGIPATGTAVMFAVPYLMTGDVKAPARNLSLYAVPRDYHGYMQGLTQTVIPQLAHAFPSHRFALFADHSPICEVDAAARAGLGVLGLHGLLITPDYGSFVFLGEVVTDADYEAVTGHTCPEFSSTPPLCEGCGTCLEACPGGCRDGSREGCLSALTQKKGILSEQEVAAIHHNRLVWGCDACQMACPHNQQVIEHGQDTPIPYFCEDRVLHLDLATLDGWDEPTFRTRAYAWRGRAVIRRNLAIMEESNERSPS